MKMGCVLQLETAWLLQNVNITCGEVLISTEKINPVQLFFIFSNENYDPK